MVRNDPPEEAGSAPESAPEVVRIENSTTARRGKLSSPPWQWSLMTLLLLTAVVAGWSATWRIGARNRQLQREIDDMRSLAGDLVVKDPSQFAIVEKPEQWHEENRWEVYLPQGGPDRLNLVTQDIPEKGLPLSDAQPAFTAQVAPGRHLIALDRVQRVDGKWQLTVEVDGNAVMTTTESGDGSGGRGPFEQGFDSRTRQEPTDLPLVLHRKIHRPSRVQGGAGSGGAVGNGVMLWFDARE